MKIEFDNEPAQTTVVIYYTPDERSCAEELLCCISNHFDVLHNLVNNKKIQLREVSKYYGADE